MSDRAKPSLSCAIARERKEPDRYTSAVKFPLLALPLNTTTIRLVRLLTVEDQSKPPLIVELIICTEKDNSIYRSKLHFSKICDDTGFSGENVFFLKKKIMMFLFFLFSL